MVPSALVVSIDRRHGPHYNLGSLGRFSLAARLSRIMISRKITAVVLMLAVASCPFVGSFSAAAAVGGGASPEIAPCCCHRHDCSPREPGKPSSPSDENPSQPTHSNCICGGAIATSEVRVPDIQADCSSSLLAVIDDLTLSQPCIFTLVDGGHRGNCHFAPLSSGRDVRILRASFLI